MPAKGRCVVAGSSKRPTGGGSEEGAGLVLGSHLFIIGINICFFKVFSSPRSWSGSTLMARR